MAPILNADAMRVLARKYDLELLKDVFHSSEGYEFRRRAKDGFACIGIIIGPVHSTIYRRNLPSDYVRWHERYWWLGGLFHRRHRCVENVPLATTPTAELTTETVDSAIRQYLLDLIAPSTP
jgi:hypothetical protein